MLCLHDITLEHDGLKSQFDFIIITNKFICVLETKKLNGNIEITNTGDFIRSIKSYNGKTIKKEGMYSPISQNERHVSFLKAFLLEHKIVRNTPIYSVVVMANPKSIINTKYASKSIKNKIIKADQLKNKLNSLFKIKSDVNLPIVTMEEIAEFIKEKSIVTNTFIEKYDKYKYDILKLSDHIVKNVVKNSVFSRLPKDELIIKLKKYRLNTSRNENIKAYMIFTNVQMENIIDLYPKNIEELRFIKGFADVKINKYGNQIIDIFKN